MSHLSKTHTHKAICSITSLSDDLTQDVVACQPRFRTVGFHQAQVEDKKTTVSTSALENLPKLQKLFIWRHRTVSQLPHFTVSQQIPRHHVLYKRGDVEVSLHINCYVLQNSTANTSREAFLYRNEKSALKSLAIHGWTGWIYRSESSAKISSSCFYFYLSHKLY